jgi:TatD DNase family protein
MLIDSHCHLDFPDFAEDFDAVIARAEAAGVGRMVSISTRLKDFEAVRAIAGRDARISCSVGIHPHNVEEEPDVPAAELVARTHDEKVVGIGETGLDFFYDHSPRDLQRRSFRNHIAAARETDLPLIVHTRAADEDTVAIMRDEMGKGAYRGLIHCFSTGRDLAEAAIDMGFYISLSGILTFKKAEELRETVRALPLERLLVETDAPYLAPVPHRGKRNEPAFVAQTAACLAELKGISLEEVARITTANFFDLFTRVPKPGAAA